MVSVCWRSGQTEAACLHCYSSTGQPKVHDHSTCQGGQEYRGRGIFKALLNYTVQYVRRRVRDVKFLYRLQAADVRVPSGYEIIKQVGLVIIFVSGKATLSNEMSNFVHSKVQFLTWRKLKILYDNNDTVKDLFINSVLEIGGEIFNLNFAANWKLLEERYDACIMLTKHGIIDGKEEMMVSFLRSGKFVTTNEGVPMAAMTVYGLNKSGVMGHIAKGILETSKHVERERFAVEVFLSKDVFKECVNFLKKVSSWDIWYHLEMNLLFGDLSRNLEDIQSN